MAYQTGAPSSTKNLIDTFITWLTTNAGFTLGNTWTFQTAAGWNGVGAGSVITWTARALGRDGQYALLAWPSTAPDRLLLNSSTNNPTTGLLTAQTGACSQNLVIELGTAPLKYYMFGDDNNGHCVVEWIGGAYQHINVGYVTKYGAWTGGVYVCGAINSRQYNSGGNYYTQFSGGQGAPFDSTRCYSGASGSGSYPGHLRCTYNSQTIYSFGSSSNIGGIVQSLGLKGQDYSPSAISYMINRTPNAYNSRSILIPIELIVGSSVSHAPAQWIPIGRVDNASHINIANLNPGDTILTDWMVFPWSAKNSGGTTAAGYVNSGNYGMAYKK